MRAADVFELFGLASDNQTEVIGVCDAREPVAGHLGFIMEADSSTVSWVAQHPATLFIVPDGEAWPTNCIPAANPRLAYAVASQEIIGSGAEAGISPLASVSPDATIGSDVAIGPFTVVDAGVTIGDRTQVSSHVRLHAGVAVGADARIESHTSIGSSGFGFEVNSDGRPVRIAHVGGVRIGNRVEIGTNVAIAQGTLRPTVIEDDAKIDDCVFIAHNVFIERATYVIAGAMVCGSVRIGAGSWVSPGSTIINKAEIGAGALIGLGAVVISNVDANTVVAGVPAKPRGERK